MSAVVSAQVTWHGTQQESLDLNNAIARNCACEFGMMGVRTSTCVPHDALIHDQRFLDGLLYVRRWLAIHAPDAGKRVIHT